MKIDLAYPTSLARRSRSLGISPTELLTRHVAALLVLSGGIGALDGIGRPISVKDGQVTVSPWLLHVASRCATTPHVLVWRAEFSCHRA